MKIHIHIIYLAIAFTMYSFAVYAQNNSTDSLKIDSLKKVLLTQKEDTNKVNTLNVLSLEFLQNNDSINAMQYAEKALFLAEKINFKKGKGNAYNCIASVYHTHHKLNEAFKNYSIALKIQEEVGDKIGSADSYLSIAKIYMTQDNDPEALDKFYKAFNLYENLGDKKNVALSLQMIGAIYFDQGNDLEGLKNYIASLKLYKEVGYKWGIALSHTNIGAIYFRQGRYPEALQEHFIALEMYKKPEEWVPNWGIPLCYANIGDVYQKQGQLAYLAGDKKASVNKFAEALNKYLEASRIAEKNLNPGIAYFYFKLGDIYIKLKNLSAAKYYLKKSLQLSIAIRDKETIKNSYSSLSNLDSIQGNFEQAYEHSKMYILYRDSLLNQESTKKIVQSKMQYEFDKKEAVAKAEQEMKDVEAKRIKNQQYFAIAGLVIVVLAVVIIAFIQWRHNKHKQKANALLQQQKEKVETTLSELKATQSQLIQSEKMASLGELTAGIAHEIQNPLNFVNNFSDINTELIDELKGERSKAKGERNKELEDEILGDIEQNLQKISLHGKRADSIVKGMLQHSQKSTGHKEPTDINKLVDEYLRLSYHGMRAKDKDFNADMKTEFDENIGKINVIPQDIGRVLLNLYNNAFYAVNEKKKSPHPLKGSEEYEPTVIVSTKTIGNRVEIKVIDNGNGIPQKIVDKIFQPFFTTKPTGQGTGLGLSLSYDIIKAHGGEIRVETKEGEGTTFIIQLPVN